MKVLVAYASRHGATAEIAEAIASGLVRSGLSAEARPAKDVTDVSSYDAFVIGSAAYINHWLREATAFAKRHRKELAGRPIWLFSSGPLGSEQVDEHGADVADGARPREFEELQPILHARGEQVFFGAWDPSVPAIGLGERLVRAMPAARDALPAGDFRDWAAIDAWTAEISAELRAGFTQSHAS